ncbi:patatin-like phospholipase family protein [Antrihabitans stalactiti]|uniref:Patatin n=1 Tax=Antrihabitans stalactiti TaxID=2584121 RepID=A0A848KFA3_9NOCA|nr:patatin-like phospholipase family protein [Antrihabitans stalactiti]NMN95392.1 patatin [Antrihabitans stalactiti]
MSIRQRSRGLVLGCGGTLGAAWTVAALAAVRDELAWDPREADVIVGTSAGAELATMLGSGVSVDEILEMQLGTSTHPALAQHLADAPGRFPPIPRLSIGSLRLASRGLGVRNVAGLLPVGRGDAAWLDRLATQLNPGRSWVSHPATWLVGMDYDTGDRVPFGSPTAPAATISEALRASWGVPGWFPPVEIAGHRYVDGGTASTASADLVAPLGLDEVIVLAPMASSTRIPGRGLDVLERVILRNHMSATLDRDVALLEQSGTRLIRIDATATDLTVMGPNFMDDRRRLATLEHALRSTRTAVEKALVAA